MGAAPACVSHVKAMAVDTRYLKGGMYAAGFSARSANPRDVPNTQSAGSVTDFASSLGAISCHRALKTRHSAQKMLQARGIAGLRVLMGLLSLKHHFALAHVNRACRAASDHGPAERASEKGGSLHHASEAAS